MRLEGTLDAFSLPDIFQLLSFTKKTGALHLRSPVEDGSAQLHGVVHVRGGQVTGARSDAGRQELGRRLVGTGLVDDQALAQAAEELADEPGAGLARLLAEKAALDSAVAARVASEQITDAVFDLLRWPNGEFAFVVGEPGVDDLGAELAVDQLVAQCEERLASWASVAEQVPAPHAVLHLSAAAPADLSVSPEEWTLLALVDGRRTVADLVSLSGQGEYAVVTVLAALVGRGLLVTGAGDDRLLRRHLLLSALEGETPAVPVPPAVGTTVEPAALVPEQPVQVPGLPPGAPGPLGGSPLTPRRPEPLAPAGSPDQASATPRVTLSSAPPLHGSVHGATALQPDAVPAPSGLVERDPNINQALLLRLIAGVRGL